MKRVAEAKKAEILTAIFGSVEEAEARLDMVREVFEKVDQWAESSFFASLIEQVEGGKITPHFDTRSGTLDFVIGEPTSVTNDSPLKAEKPAPKTSKPRRVRRAFKNSDVRKISLDELRKEADKLGIDVSHLGRKKKEILALLNSSAEEPEEVKPAKSVVKPKPKAVEPPLPQTKPPQEEKPSDDLNFLDDFDNEPVDGGSLSEGFEVVVDEVYIPKSTKFNATLSTTFAKRGKKANLNLGSIRASAGEIDVEDLLKPEPKPEA